jgi:hypothetical protein
METAPIQSFYGIDGCRSETLKNPVTNGTFSGFRPTGDKIAGATRIIENGVVACESP